MEKKTYEHLVLGGGSGGYAAARTAHEYGLSTAVVDGSERLGGLCILRGCMPSKTVIESANRFRTIRHAEKFGLRAPNPSVVQPEVIERKRELVNEFAKYRVDQLEDGRFDLHRGTAEFIDEHTVRVTPIDGSEPYEVGFKTATIATGSSPRELPLRGLQDAGYWLSRDALEAQAVPDHLIVFGGGAIALEAACQFEGLGGKVTVIQRSEHLLSGTDHDLADALEGAMLESGMTIYTGTHLKKVEIDPDGRKRVFFEHHGEEKEIVGDQILQGLGRVPHTSGLCIEGLGDDGLKRRNNAIWTDEGMTTSLPHIFAAGDVTSPIEVVHIAVEQGEIAAQNAAKFLGKHEKPTREIDYRLKVLGIFSHPEVATVGLSELEAESTGRKVLVAKEYFNDHGKSMVMGETAGFVKMIADAETKELIGAAVVGPHAVDLIHELVVALHFRCTAEEFLKIPHYHPTLSEIWTYPAEEISEM